MIGWSPRALFYDRVEVFLWCGGLAVLHLLLGFRGQEHNRGTRGNTEGDNVNKNTPMNVYCNRSEV